MNTVSMAFLKLLRIAAMASLLFIVTGYSSLASAAQGCGFGFHRNFFGACVYNRPGPYATPAPRYPGCWRNWRGALRCY